MWLMIYISSKGIIPTMIDHCELVFSHLKQEGRAAMFVKRRIVILLVMLVIIPISIDLVSLMDKGISNQRYEEICRTIINSPRAVVIIQDERDITQEFLDNYGDSIGDDNYDEAIAFLQEEHISITIEINEKNQVVLGD